MSACSLYRHFDASGKLLYVGISHDALGRLNSHSHCSHWYPQIASMTIENFASRAEAEYAERAAIRNEKPWHNVTYNLSNRAAYGNANRARDLATLRARDPARTVKSERTQKFERDLRTIAEGIAWFEGRDVPNVTDWTFALDKLSASAAAPPSAPPVKGRLWCDISDDEQLSILRRAAA